MKLHAPVTRLAVLDGDLPVVHGCLDSLDSMPGQNQRRHPHDALHAQMIDAFDAGGVTAQVMVSDDDG